MTELETLEHIRAQAAAAAEELVRKAGLRRGQIVIVGCSTSAVNGSRIGQASAPEVGQVIFEGIRYELYAKGIYLAAQCCEHLNRAVITEAKAVPGAEIVNVVPQPKAGGSFATAAYKSLPTPVAVEHIRADAGLDIGGVLIGMHLKEVAVPVQLEHNTVGQALILAARTRPKFIGGSRAIYDESLK